MERRKKNQTEEKMPGEERASIFDSKFLTLSLSQKLPTLPLKDFDHRNKREAREKKFEKKKRGKGRKWKESKNVLLIFG